VGRLYPTSARGAEMGHPGDCGLKRFESGGGPAPSGSFDCVRQKRRTSLRMTDFVVGSVGQRKNPMVGFDHGVRWGVLELHAA